VRRPAVRSSSTRSASYRPPPRRRCYACSKSTRCCPWALRSRCRSTSASSPPR
jgi:hypothetical protein